MERSYNPQTKEDLLIIKKDDLLKCSTLINLLNYQTVGYWIESVQQTENEIIINLSNNTSHVDLSENIKVMDNIYLYRNTISTSLKPTIHNILLKYCPHIIKFIEDNNLYETKINISTNIANYCTLDNMIDKDIKFEDLLFSNISLDMLTLLMYMLRFHGISESYVYQLDQLSIQKFCKHRYYEILTSKDFESFLENYTITQNHSSKKLNLINYHDNNASINNINLMFFNLPEIKIMWIGTKGDYH